MITGLDDLAGCLGSAGSLSTSHSASRPNRPTRSGGAPSWSYSAYRPPKPAPTMRTTSAGADATRSPGALGSYRETVIGRPADRIYASARQLRCRAAAPGLPGRRRRRGPPARRLHRRLAAQRRCGSRSRCASCRCGWTGLASSRSRSARSTPATRRRPLRVDLERCRVVAQLEGHVGRVFSARWSRETRFSPRAPTAQLGCGTERRASSTTSTEENRGSSRHNAYARQPVAAGGAGRLWS